MKIRRTIAASAIVLATLGVSAAYATTTEVGMLTYGGETFQAWAVDGGITWNDADAYAISNGYQLASLNTSQENTAVYNWLNPSNFPSLWLNANNLGPWIGGIQTGAGPFHWSDGSGTLTSHFETTNWGTGQPDAAEGYPNAILFYPVGGTWGDYGADCGVSTSPNVCAAGNVYGFVTETAVPEPLTLSLFGAGLAGAAALRRRKKKTA